MCTGYLDYDFHPLVCTINQIARAKGDFVNRPILIIKSGSVPLSPLKIWVEERSFSFQESQG